MISKNSRKHFFMFYSAYVGDDFRSDLGITEDMECISLSLIIDLGFILKIQKS